MTAGTQSIHIFNIYDSLLFFITNPLIFRTIHLCNRLWIHKCVRTAVLRLIAEEWRGRDVETAL
jgi:hypothetical protein